MRRKWSRKLYRGSCTSTTLAAPGRMLPRPRVNRLTPRAAYHQKIGALVRDLALRHEVPAARVWIVEGDAAQSLPAFAKSESADIVALGAVLRGRSRVETRVSWSFLTRPN